MSWVTIIWSMTIWACLTLAILHLVIWFKQTDQFAFLLFSVIGTSVAAIAVCELLAMHARSSEQFGRVVWWAHLPVFFAVEIGLNPYPHLGGVVRAGFDRRYHRVEAGRT